MKKKKKDRLGRIVVFQFYSFARKNLERPCQYFFIYNCLIEKINKIFQIVFEKETPKPHVIFSLLYVDRKS